jgi:hypothetical protein
VTSRGQLSARPHFVRGFINRQHVPAQNQGRIMVEITVTVCVRILCRPVRAFYGRSPSKRAFPVFAIPERTMFTRSQSSTDCSFRTL